MSISKDFPNERTESLCELFYSVHLFISSSPPSSSAITTPKYLVYLYLCTHFIQGAGAQAHAIQSSNEINKVKLRLVKSIAGFCVYETLFTLLRVFRVF